MGRFAAVRKALYRTQRGMSDLEAAERGPAPLGKRLGRRYERRFVGRLLQRFGL